MSAALKVVHIMRLRIDDYQKAQIAQGRNILYAGECDGVQQELESSQVKHWSVDHGTLALEIKKVRQTVAPFLLGR